MPRYTIGVDFGTASGRAVLVDVADGRVLASVVVPYPHGVIDERLPSPHGDVVLPPEWALHDPEDYLHVLRTAVPAAIREAGVDPTQVIGLGIDATSCTMLPTRADGTALAELPAFRPGPMRGSSLEAPCRPARGGPHQRRGAGHRPGLAGSLRWPISSEWFFAKALEILDDDPELYAAADRLIEVVDWVVWRLTGVETRNACTAGYKALWSKRDGFPSRDDFAALDPRFADVVDDKMLRELQPVGARAGGLSAEARRVDRAAGRDGRGRGQCGRPRRGPGSDRDRGRPDGHDHGHLHLPHGPVP